MAREQIKACSRRAVTAFPRTLRIAATLAASLVLIIIGYVLIAKGLNPENSIRSGRMAELRLLQPKERLKEAPKVFSWSKVGGSNDYSLEIIDSALETVYEKSLAGTELKVPEELRQKLVRNRPYLWTVVAQDDNGRELASASRYFEIE